jgi:HEAT repeat protein
MAKRYVAMLIIVITLMAAFGTGCERQRGRKVTNLEYGSDMLSAGKAFQSIDYLEKALKEEPDNPLVYAYLVIAYRRAQSDSATAVAGKMEEFARKEKETFQKLQSMGRAGMEALIEIASKQNRLMTDALDLLVQSGQTAVQPIVDFLTDGHKRSRYPGLIPQLKKTLVKMGAIASDELCAALSKPGLPLTMERDLVEVLGEIGDPKTSSTLEKCAVGTDPVVKIESIVALYRLGKKGYAKQILQALDHENAEVRRIASEALMLINHVPEKVVVRKLDDEDPIVRVNVIKKLDKNPPKSLEDKLIKMLSSDSSDEVQNAVADALEGYGPSIAKRLINMLPKETEWDVRLRIIKILKSSSVIKGIDNDGEYDLYEAYQGERNKIVKDELAQLLTKLQNQTGG